MSVSLCRAALRNFGATLPHQTRGLQSPSSLNSVAIIRNTYVQHSSLHRKVVMPNFIPMTHSMSFFNPHSACGAVSLLGRKSNDGPNMAPLLTTALLSAAYITTKNVNAEEESSSIEFNEKILPLLNKNPATRTIEEKIVLFNYLLSKGEEEAAKAKGKHIVVVFGDTGAGKSTLINYLYGCKMTVNDGGIIVDQNSEVKEVATIGGDITSCTFIPKKIPEVQFSIKTKQHRITFYDMPGLGDNRGIEVALANTIALKRLVEYAKSVQFVMVFEQPQLNAVKGAAWIQSLKLLKERFGNTVGGVGNLSVIMTKQISDLVTIIKDVEKYAKGYPDLPNLSNDITIYDPLNPKERTNTLQSITNKTIYSNLASQISVSGGQLWSAQTLGGQIQKEVLKILKGVNISEINVEQEIKILLRNNPSIAKAVEMLKFTHGIANLGNANLTPPHEKACKGVLDLAEEAIRRIEDGVNINMKLDEYKRYKMLRKIFSPYMNFAELDRRFGRVIVTVKDERFHWHTIDKSIGGSIASIGLGLLATLNPIFALGLLFSVPFTGIAVANWLNPSKKDLDMDAFFACEL